MGGEGGAERGAVELKEAIARRHSVRRYREEPVPQELVTEILQLASRAPSAGGLRAYMSIATEEQLTNVKSPLSLVICALPEVSGKRYGERGRSLYAIQDATIYGAYIQLIALDYGLSSVWVGAFREGRVKRILGLGENIRPVAIIHLGYKEE